MVIIDGYGQSIDRGGQSLANLPLVARRRISAARMAEVGATAESNVRRRHGATGPGATVSRYCGRIMPLDRSVVVEGLNIHYREAGQGSALLLVHGWPTNAHLWRNIIEPLADHRRVIAIDLPGFGDSDKPLDVSYSFRFFDRILDGFLDAVGVERVGLVVHDLGGPIGLHWAVGHADRVLELAVLNTIALAKLHIAVKAFVSAASLPLVRDLLTHPRGIVAAMRLGVVDKSVITPDVAELYVRPFSDRSARKALAKAGRGLHPKGLLAIERGLPELNVPSRLIYGAQDKVLPDVEQTMQRLSTFWPDAALTRLPNAGHFLQEDAPQEVARLLSTWLAPRP